MAQRRTEVGDFVVGDDGLGYADIGEEDEWQRHEEGDSEDDDEAAIEARRKKAAKMARGRNSSDFRGASKIVF